MPLTVIYANEDTLVGYMQDTPIDVIKNGYRNFKGGEYPGQFMEVEKEIINKKLVGKTLHLFSGKSTIGEARIDFGCEEATLNEDVFDYLPHCKSGEFGCVLIDPPYNKKFAQIYQKLYNTPPQFILFANARKTTLLFNLIRDCVNPKRIIIRSWNCYVPRNYCDCGSFMIYPGGYRRSTVLMVTDKVAGVERERATQIDQYLRVPIPGGVPKL